MNEQNIVGTSFLGAPKNYSSYFKSAFSFFGTLSTLGLYSMFLGSAESKLVERRDFQDTQDIGTKSLVNATVQGFEIGRSNLPVNATAYDVAIQGNYAYVASGIKGIQVVDLNAPNSPVSSYYTGGFARQIDIIGKTAWVAADTAGMLVLDITNPFNISQKYNSYQLLNSYPVTKLRISNNNIFLANNNNPSLAILDNTSSFKAVIGTAYSESRAVFDIFSLGNEAYIAYPGIGVGIVDATSFPKVRKLALPNAAIPTDTFVIGSYSLVTSDKGFHVVDITNSTNPQQLGQYNTSGQASGIFALGKTAYVTDTQGLHLIDYTNPNIPILISSLNAANATAVYVNGNNKLAYLAQGNAGLQVVDLSNPTVPTLKGSAYKATAAKDVVIDSTGRIAYVAAGTAGLQVIDIRDPNSLKLFGSLLNNNGKGNTQAVAVLDNILCIADGPNGLGVVDVSDPNNPKLLGSYPTPNAVDVSIIGQTVYLNDQTRGLYVFDISRFGAPELLSRYASTAGNIQGLSTANSKAYIASAQGLQIIDAPLWKGRIPKPTAPMQIAALGNNLYIASFQQDLYNVDISDRASPKESVNIYKMQGYARDMAITKDYLFIAEGANGIEILNINNPQKPLLVGQINTGLRYARGLNLVGNRLHVADDAGGLVIYQIDIQPLIQTNQLFIFSNQTITLGLENLNVVDTDNTPAELSFTISNLNNGFFAKTPNNMTSILNFTLEDIINDKILFTATGVNSVAGTPSYRVSVSDGLMTDGPYNSLVFYNQPPILLNNALQISQGTSIVITTKDIDAEPISNNTNAYNMTAMMFRVDQISNAYFALSQNSTVPINQFTQQDIVNGIVVLIPDGTNNAPNITVSLSNGANTIVPQALNVNFQGVPQVPRIVNNTLVINEGQATILTLDQLSAYDLDTSSYSDTLQFSVNTIGYGRFSRVNTTVILGQFYQKDIKDGNIQFISIKNTNSVASFYDIAVATSFKSTNFTNGIVNFDPASRLLQNTLTIGKGESVVITPAQLQAIVIVGTNDTKATYVPESNASLIFEISQIANGQFELIQNPGTPINSFSQQQVMDGNTIRFVHNASSDVGPEYAVSVRGQRIVTPNQTATVFFRNQQTANNTPLIAGSTVAGIAGLGALLVGAGFFAKNRFDLESRKKHQLARYLRRHLEIGEINNFNSKEGQAFVDIVEQQLTPELKEHGYDVNKMSDYDIENLAKNLTTVMKNNDYLMPSNSTINPWGRPILDLDSFGSNVQNIVQDMLNQTHLSTPTQTNNVIW